MDALGIIGLTLLGVFSLFIFRKNNKETSDYLLIILNLVLAITIYSEYAVFGKNENGINLFVHFNGSFFFVSAFIFYAYSLVRAQGNFIFKWWFIGVSLPFAVYSGVDIFILHSGESEYFQTLLLEPNIIYHIFFKSLKIYVILLGLDILKRIRIYGIRLKNKYSSIEKSSLHWLRNFTVFMILNYSFQLVAFLLYNFGFIPEIDIVYLALGVLNVFGLLYLTYYGIQQYNIPDLSDPFDQPNEITINAPDSKKSEEYERIYSEVVSYFEEEKPYINPELRIGTISDHLNIPTHKISAAINEYFGKPFYDFVARYRIDFLKEKLVNPENKTFTILALALDSGFNSKASLNRVFKAATGYTPSEYQKSHLVK